MQKVATVKGPRKRKGKGQEKNSKTVIAKHKTKQNKEMSKFWLMRTRQIKMLYIFVPKLAEIYHFGKTMAFSAKLRPI